MLIGQFYFDDVLVINRFKRRLPPFACKFLEMCLQLTADHGPAVSGAMTTVITTRAGKDLISSLVAGLLTIGDRFGGALDGAAREFSRAKDTGLTPREFVDSMRRANKLIPGIGHKIKSKSNPDMRVELVKDFARKHFPSNEMLDYALAVEDVTSSKKDTLILNVDGCIAVCFCDLLRNSGAFSREEADEYMQVSNDMHCLILTRASTAKILVLDRYLECAVCIGSKYRVYRAPHRPKTTQTGTLPCRTERYLH